MRFVKLSKLTLAIGLGALLTAPAYAITYPSFVNPTATPNELQFVLNDAADNVTILRNGGNALNLGALPAGRHTFDMTGFSTWEIKVARDISSPSVNNTDFFDITASHVTNKFTRFERGSDVLVNKDPNSDLFGAVYVNNVRNVATAGTVRQLEDGIYALTPDLIGVDLPTRAALANPDDTSLAKKAANWELGDQSVCNPSTSSCQNFLGTVSGWRMSFDQGGNVLMSDWSDANGGIKWINPELTSGGLALRFQDGVFQVDPDGTGPAPAERIGLIPNGLGQEVHGSIVSHVYATGSVGNNLTVYGIDEDYDLDGNTFNSVGNSGNHLWKWTVGNNLGQAGDGTDAYDGAPQLVINMSLVPKTTEATPRDNWLALNVGVQADAIYSEENNKWYFTQNRSDGNQAGFIVLTPNADPNLAPTLEFSSLQFAVDNGLDGNTGATLAGIQDPFRSMAGGMELSEDGTKLYIHRVTSTNNPVLGTTTSATSTTPSNTPGSVLVIPLDANGVPQLTVSAGQITNIDSVTTALTGANLAQGTGTLRGVSVDAAGNIYTTNNSVERLQVFSPLGNYLASLKSDGTFSVAPLVDVGLDGDYNEDGSVDAADYVLWRKSPADFGGPGGYDTWKANFGNTAPGSGGQSAVPEPAAIALFAIGMFVVGGLRRQRA